MMQVLLFELAGCLLALKVESMERILAPGESLPPQAEPADLADLLKLAQAPPVIDPVQGYRAVLAGGRWAVRVGRPVGTARIEPGWILPLPAYMFAVTEAPFRGIVSAPRRRRGESGEAHPGSDEPARDALLLNEERLIERLGATPARRPGEKGGSR
ncbi:MAG TPA: hypothetical protein VFP98_02085 [Candidatus Polarisedimenticolia bacterium]|nr:hypothetical protein [Candidatus Polarisedimenticolia bacterium]